jgi:hypothetical protein
MSALSLQYRSLPLAPVSNHLYRFQSLRSKDRLQSLHPILRLNPTGYD